MCILMFAIQLDYTTSRVQVVALAVTQPSFMRLATMDGAANGCLSLKYSSGAEELLILYGCNASLDTLQYLANLMNSAISGATSPESDVYHSSPAPIKDCLTLPALVDLDCGAACVRSLPTGPGKPSLPSLETDQCKILQRLSHTTPYAAARLASMPQLISQQVQVIKGTIDGSLSISIDPVLTSGFFTSTHDFLVLSLIFEALLLPLVWIAIFLPKTIVENDGDMRILVNATLLLGLGQLGFVVCFCGSTIASTIASWCNRSPRKVTLTVGPCLWTLVGCGYFLWPASGAAEISGRIEDLFGCQVCSRFLCTNKIG
jgi:hypothetical protein